jgi:hypothetical protein
MDSLRAFVKFAAGSTEKYAFADLLVKLALNITYVLPLIRVIT